MAAWRAVPRVRRVEVVRWAKTGRRYPDEAAVQAAQQFAALCVYLQGSRPLSPRTRYVAAWVELFVVLVLVTEAVLLHRLDASGIVVVVLAVVAVVTFLHGLFWIDLLRESRRLLTLPAAQTTPPARPGGPAD